MSLDERELDELLERASARHWFEPPRTASLVERIQRTEPRRRWPIWLFAPLLAACAGASYAVVNNAQRNILVHIQLEDGGRTLDTGTHVLVIDEHGPRPIVVDVPGRGPVDFRVELPEDVPLEHLKDTRFEILFTTDPDE